jgi:hypothetical protein
VFESVGLTEHLLSIYRALLQPDLARKSRLDEFAAQLQLTEAEPAEDLDELRKLGLLVPSWLKGLDHPLDPSIAFEQLAGRRRREIGELSDALRADLAAGELFAAATRISSRRTRIVTWRCSKAAHEPINECRISIRRNRSGDLSRPAASSRRTPITRTNHISTVASQFAMSIRIPIGRSRLPGDSSDNSSSMARRLGVSMRTVRRMAAKLSEQVGASGRFELGVRAAQRGWVD